MLNYTAANEEVETLVLEMYGHFEKIMTECDPNLFFDILPLTALVFEKLDNTILKLKEYKQMLQVSEDEKENVLEVLKSQTTELKNKREEVMELQLNLDVFKCQNINIAWEHDKMNMEKEIRDLQNSLKLKSKEVTTLKSDLNSIQEKYSRMQHLYAELSLDHKNIIEATRLLEEDIKILTNSENLQNPNNIDGSFSHMSKTGKSINMKSMSHWPNLSRHTNALQLNNKYDILSQIEESVENNENNEISVLKHFQRRQPKQQETKKLKQRFAKIRTTESNSYTNKENKTVSSSQKNRLSIIADSQGRQLAGYLDNHVGGETSVFGHIQPGAPFEAVMTSAIKEIKSKQFSDSDFVIVIGGTNNITNTHFNKKTLNKQKFIKFIGSHIEMFSETNLILATIPYRYDLKEEDYQNKYIKEINIEIRNTIYNHNLFRNKPNVFLLDLHLLQKRHHTNHGFHISRSGKKWIAKQLNQLLQTSKKVTTNSTPEMCTNFTAAISQTEVATKNGINTEKTLLTEITTIDPPVAANGTTHRVLSVAPDALADVMVHRADDTSPIQQQDDYLYMLDPVTSPDHKYSATTVSSTIPVSATTSDAAERPVNPCTPCCFQEAITTTPQATPREIATPTTSHTPQLDNSSCTIDITPRLHFEGFTTPKSELQDLELLQRLVDEEMNSGSLSIDNIQSKKNTYFLRKRQKKQKTT